MRCVRLSTVTLTNFLSVAELVPTNRNDLTELYVKTTTKERYIKFWHAQTSFLVRWIVCVLAVQ